MKDGEITRDKSGRWCMACAREHGILYPCEGYPPDVLKEVKEQGATFRKQCENGTIQIVVRNNEGYAQGYQAALDDLYESMATHILNGRELSWTWFEDKIQELKEKKNET